MREYRKAHRETYNEYMRKYYLCNARKLFPRQMWLAEARRRRGLTQKYVAAVLGVNQSTISRLESGCLSIDGFSAKEKLFELLGGDIA